jgi:hypothetical protein
MTQNRLKQAYVKFNRKKHLKHIYFKDSVEVDVQCAIHCKKIKFQFFLIEEV